MKKPSRAQLEREIRNRIREAYAQGWRTDDLAIDYAVEAVGEEYRALVGRIHAREFREFGP